MKIAGFQQFYLHVYLSTKVTKNRLRILKTSDFFIELCEDRGMGGQAPERETASPAESTEGRRKGSIKGCQDAEGGPTSGCNLHSGRRGRTRLPRWSILPWELQEFIEQPSVPPPCPGQSS